MQLVNPGGRSFSLGPRDSRVIRPRLISGQDFTAAEVQLSGNVAIELVVLADGLAVGGLTFVLDPHLHHPAREFPDEPGLEHHGEHLDEPKKERRDDEPRRIRLEIDLD
jgi:hypothetical protein